MSILFYNRRLASVTASPEPTQVGAVWHWVCPIEGRESSTLCLTLNNSQVLLKWFAQLVLAVDYLHSNYVLHRDLKVSANK